MQALQFHLSIPAHDLAETRRWYVEGLGCRAGRSSAHALILDLGGHQLVAQLTAPELSATAQAGIYPRHFGLVFAERSQWQALLARAQAAGLRFGVEPRQRFVGEVTEHATFFLIDPSGNWLEFKHYVQPEAVLGCEGFAGVGDARPAPVSPPLSAAQLLRLRARLLEFLKFRVLAAQEDFLAAAAAECDAAGPLPQAAAPHAPAAHAPAAAGDPESSELPQALPGWLRPWLARHWPEALALPDSELCHTLETARRLYVN
ncbi:MAG: VOC family protein [Synechococcaceae cyanobacterium]|nr:VOC family protein [Synechococcaceae cyanobacterium]